MSEPRTIAILAYHKIGPPPSDGWETWNYVSESLFEEQLVSLREGGWEFIDVAQLIAALDRPQLLPPRSALLTFDDACRSLLGPAREILLRLKYPSIVFVPTKFIGGWNDFDNGAEPREAICSWDDLRELEQSGFSVQSHGISHVALSEMPAAEQQREIAESKLALEDHLKKSVDLYSFAFGDEGHDLTATAGFLKTAGYKAAVRYGGGLVRLPIENPYRLARVAIGSDTDLRTELKKLTQIN